MPQETQQAIDRTAFRRVLGTFATGVTIITTTDGAGQPHGLTANSFTSVSLDPPLVLVCLDKRSKSLSALEESQVFAVNILSEGQRDLSGGFARKSDDKFAGVAWSTASTGAPVFPDSVGWLDCRVHQTISSGDHDVVIGQVVAMSDSPARPLGYFRGNYFQVSLEQDVSERRGRAVFSVIIDHLSGVLLARRGEQTAWSLPEAPATTGEAALGGLLRMLADAGAPTELNFLYSVAEISDAGCTAITYRGELTGEPMLTAPANWCFFTEAEIPWASLASYETEMTLRRYFREKKLDRFGLFADTGESGRIALIGHDLRSYSRDDAERDLR